MPILSGIPPQEVNPGFDVTSPTSRDVCLALSGNAGFEWDSSTGGESQ